MAAHPVLIVAILTIAPGARDIFHAFESQAVAIMATHGGVLERTIAVDPSPGASDREVHVIRFPSTTAWTAYRTDPALAALAPLRHGAIAHTEILLGTPGPSYDKA